MKLNHAFVCPFCMNDISEEYNYCCGEAGHGEWMWFDDAGEPVQECNGCQNTDCVWCIEMKLDREEYQFNIDVARGVK
jgi:hypothetical protein